MKYPLSNTLETLRDHISEQLISPECMAVIQRVAAYFPAPITSTFGFESRLWEEEAKADFLFCVSSDHSQKDILAGKNPMLSIPDFEYAEPVWKNIKDFARWWRDSNESLSKIINRAWLEFDMNETMTAIPIPGIFWGLDSCVTKTSMAEEYKRNLLMTVERVYHILKGKPISQEQRQTLVSTIEAIPGRCKIEQVGFMLSRDIDALRLVITKLGDIDLVTSFLEQINWPGSIGEFSQFLNTLIPYVKFLALNIDVGNQIYPRIGLECYVDYYPRGFAQRKRLVDYLMREQLCTPAKRNALLDWHGYFRTQFLHEFWESLVVKRFHHIKVDYRPGDSLRAKAYVGFASHRVGSPIFKKVTKQVLTEGVAR